MPKLKSYLDTLALSSVSLKAECTVFSPNNQTFAFLCISLFLSLSRLTKVFQFQDFIILGPLLLWSSHFAISYFYCFLLLFSILPLSCNLLFRFRSLIFQVNSPYDSFFVYVTLAHMCTLHLSIPSCLSVKHHPSSSVSILSSHIPRLSLKSSEAQSELMPLCSAFILTEGKKERERGKCLDPGGA